MHSGISDSLPIRANKTHFCNECGPMAKIWGDRLTSILPEILKQTLIPYRSWFLRHLCHTRQATLCIRVCNVGTSLLEKRKLVIVLFFLGTLKAMKAKVLPECEGRRLLQFGWGLPVYLVYLFTSVHGWEGASCIWLQHVLASSNRPLCFLSLEADTQHVVHKLMAGRFGHSLLLGNIPAIYNFIRLANSCLMSKDPAARHFYVFSTFLDPEQCRAGCGLQGPYKKQVHWKRRSFDMWHEWLITGPVAVHFVVVSAHLMFSCTWA